LVVILRPEITDEDLPSAIERVQQFITDRGGEVKDTDRWGRRKLAYPIKSCMEGTYVVSQLNMEPRDAHEFEGNLRLNDQVIRHLLIKTDD
jgi:small subunit ribosomal protein S6